ncbi:23S rRNA (adenine(2030)-N(6))-methyltransferase RlmJ [Marinobacter mobilis]|uniref:23S rRNA (adenine(2030)-N(6))-methyltransferase RlmJ n=1 Tax=Marinobacter mobilis TaxID=488533 RepID=UPI0035C66725
MLSYLHAFHAGNFADVQKHGALTLVLEMMQAKPSGIACFDTHAGSVLYDLAGERARKTGESDTGIQRLWEQREAMQGSDWAPVFGLLETLNPGQEQLTRYPGSPAWFQQFLRSTDTLTAFELHPSEGQQLADWASHERVQVFQEDGLRGLLKKLPPKQPRLLVLVDPSYEIKSDYAEVAGTLTKAWQKCRHGVFLIWYPILTSGLQHGLLEGITRSPVRKVLRSEIHLQQPPARGMTGSGMLVVNPPWGYDSRLTAMLASVSEGLGIRRQMDWLVPE